MKKNLLTGAALIAFALTFAACGTKAKNAAYDFTAVSRGSLEKTVSSSGTINPVATVKVLPRMSGKVEKIYVDYNDTIKKGDVLAELNTDMLRLQREQQMAQVIKTRANYELQSVNYRNQQALAEKNLISEYELKTGKTTLDVQAAELSATEANLKSIETEINQYAYITSPIDGIVLERKINEGDTVVDSSSSNSSAIFTLAENLEEMQIESWVGELDIATISEGQDVRFTLEAMPGRNFTGTVESKRLMPQIVDNVVSYNVIISVNNKDGALLPGMTCAVEFIEERREDILLVSNAALRFTPTSLTTDEIGEKVFNASLKGMNDEQKQAAIDARAEAQKNTAAAGTSSTNANAQSGISGLLAPSMPGGGRMRAPGGQGNAAQRQGTGTRTGAAVRTAPRPLWFIGADGKPDCILVRTGITNGISTEVSPVHLFRAESDTEPEAALEGMKIILREKI
ncbi:MAG: efflux RND transporter periplasmic adaptor subunit [Treponema sp.]|nr:efflux RND transporter periplasmic adaptor subunit [Treponema sp.]